MLTATYSILRMNSLKIMLEYIHVIIFFISYWNDIICKLGKLHSMRKIINSIFYFHVGYLCVNTITFIYYFLTNDIILLSYRWFSLCVGTYHTQRLFTKPKNRVKKLNGFGYRLLSRKTSLKHVE